MGLVPKISAPLSVTVPVALVLSLSTCKSYTHQRSAPAAHRGNECPTFLLLKFDDALLKSFFIYFPHTFSSRCNFGALFSVKFDAVTQMAPLFACKKLNLWNYDKLRHDLNQLNRWQNNLIFHSVPHFSFLIIAFDAWIFKQFDFYMTEHLHLLQTGGQFKVLSCLLLWV